MIDVKNSSILLYFVRENYLADHVNIESVAFWLIEGKVRCRSVQMGSIGLNLIFFLYLLIVYVCFSVEASVHGTSIHCSDKTFEAAEALLRMDSPSSLREDRSPGNTHTY